jgi:hypothetical protein
VQVLATRGDGIFLLGVGDGQGVILHADSEPPRIYLPPKRIESHAKWGYWQEFDGDHEQILKLAERATEVIDPRPAPTMFGY